MQIIITPEELRAYERNVNAWMVLRMQNACDAFALAQSGMAGPSRQGKEAAQKADLEFIAKNPHPKLIPAV